ncbi:hypothetical protein AAKU67_003630 [Oxalobacteraceae bacterium GrIS 2.11]
MEYTSQATSGRPWGVSNNWRSSEWRNVPLSDDDELSNGSSEGTVKLEPRTDPKEPINLDMRRMAENRPIASPPSQNCLQRFGRKCLSPVLGHSFVKGLGGWAIIYTSIWHRELLGAPQYSTLVAGALALLISTVISLNNCRKERWTSVLAESVGYAAVGPILGIIELARCQCSSEDYEPQLQAVGYRAIPEA